MQGIENERFPDLSEKWGKKYGNISTNLNISNKSVMEKEEEAHLVSNHKRFELTRKTESSQLVELMRANENLRDEVREWKNRTHILSTQLMDALQGLKKNFSAFKYDTFSQIHHFKQQMETQLTSLQQKYQYVFLFL